MPVLSEVICNVLGYENVSGVAAIEHALGDINACTGDVDAVVNVGDLIHRPTMNSHPHLKPHRTAQLLRDLQCALDRLFEIFEKEQSHPVAGRQTNQFILCFGGAKTLGLTNNSI